MPTGTALLENAAFEVGVLTAGESLATRDRNFILDKMNMMLGSWNIQESFIFATQQFSFVFTTSQQTYTIGRSGAEDQTADRPIKILAANLVLVSSDPDVNIPLEVINVEEYAAIRVPALTSTIPIRLYYAPTIPDGTLYPWPQPTDTSNKLELFYETPIAAIAVADVGNSYGMAPGYERAITLSLAEEIAGAFGATISRDLDKKAREARAAIRSNNSPTPLMSLRDTGIPHTGGRSRPDYNWLYGNFS